MQTPNDESKLSDNNIQCRYDVLSIYNEKKKTVWVLSWWREFFSRLLMEFLMAHSE